MKRRPPSLRRLALLLTLPVLLVAGMGLWVIMAERGRIENEWRAEAERLRDGLLTELPVEVVPRIHQETGSALESQLAEAGSMVPRWVLRGMDPPPAGKGWSEYETLLQSIREGRREDALKARDAAELYAMNEFSPAGTPLMPLVWRAVMELYAGEERVAAARSAAHAAVEYPSLLTSRLLEDALAHLPEEERGGWRAKAVQAAEMYAGAEAIGRQHRSISAVPSWQDIQDDRGFLPVTGEWSAIGLVRHHSSRLAQVIPYEEIETIMQPLVQRFSPAAAGGLSLLPEIAWHGGWVHVARNLEPRALPTPSPFARPRLERGVELATGGKGAWRVWIYAVSPNALAAALAERTRSLVWLLACVLLVVNAAMVLTWRTFKKQAELSRMQTEFVASVSHELRTPVASIGALAERLEGGKADAAQTKEYHRLIAREGRRLAALVDNVLDFSRIERGAKAYDFEHTDLPRLVRETCALLRPQAEEKGLTLVEEVAEIPEDRWPLVDAVALRQALVNLLDNAIKFTPAGGTVTVKFSALDRDVLIHVCDTGIGIPPAEHARIFERFHRVDNGLRRETTGAGIGLSIVKHIAEAHGGRVSVESEAGQGAVFAIHFSKSLKDEG